MHFSRVSNPAAVVVVALAELVLLTLCYLAGLSLTIRDLALVPYLRTENGVSQVFAAVVAMQFILYFMGLYGDLRSFSRTLFFQQLLTATGISFLLQALIGYGSWQALQMPQWAMMYGSGLCIVVLTAWRTMFFSWIRDALPSRKLLFLGNSPELHEIVETLRAEPHAGYAVTRCVESFAAYEAVGFVSDIDEIVVAEDPADFLPAQALMDARLYGVQIEDALTLYETLFGRVPVAAIPPVRDLFTDLGSPRPGTLFLQSLYSRALALVILLLTAPLLLLLMLLLKLGANGEAIFHRARMAGLHGVPFTMYTLRAPKSTTGRWMRHFRLDCLPLFWNILRGDMVLIGPKAVRMEFYPELCRQIHFFRTRQSVRPGLIGWAQVNHVGSNIRVPLLELEYDLYYVKHLAPALDAYILLRLLREQWSSPTTPLHPITGLP